MSEPARPLDDLPLDELIRRWSEVQARDCLCGGKVIANVIDPTAGVEQHQQTRRHRRWADRIYGL